MSLLKRLSQGSADVAQPPAAPAPPSAPKHEAPPPATLRMRPDRVIVGECRGGEALDMLQAMNTGHDGSLTTGHANSPRDMLSRLETMVLMAGMDLPVRAIREQISAAVDVIVQQSRMRDGSRKVKFMPKIDEAGIALPPSIFGLAPGFF